MMTSITGTDPIAIRVNIPTGEENGMNEQIRIMVLSVSPRASGITTRKKEIMNSIVIGITAVVASSSRDTIDPTAPYRNAYSRKPRKKNSSSCSSRAGGGLKMDEMIMSFAQDALFRR